MLNGQFLKSPHEVSLKKNLDATKHNFINHLTKIIFKKCAGQNDTVIKKLKIAGKKAKSLLNKKNMYHSSIQKLSVEVNFKIFWRTVAGALGAAIVIVGIQRAVSFQGTWSEGTYLGVLFFFGAILMFVAIAYEKIVVKIALVWKN